MGVPALKEATPALINSTKEGVITYATLTATYVASFNIAHLLLKASDLCMETADSVLKWTCNEKAKVLEDASLTWAIVEIAGLASYFTKLQAFTPSFAATTASSSPLDTK